MSISKYTARLAVWVIVVLIILSQNDLVSSEPLQNEYPTDTGCRNNNTSVAYQMSLRTALAQLTDDAAGNATFSNSSVRVGYDTVFALYYCTGNVTAERCSACVQAVARDVVKHCNDYKEGMAWSYDCTLWYADWMIFGSEDGKMAVSKVYPTYLGSYDYKEMALAREVGSKTAEELSQTAANDTGFAMTEVAVSLQETLVGLAQCAPWVVGGPCLRCLRNATGLWDKLYSRQYMGYRSFTFLPSCRLHLSVEVGQPPLRTSSNTSTSVTPPGTVLSSIGGEALKCCNNI